MSNIKSKINIYISSKYRQQDEQTSDFKVVIPDGLLKCARDEYFTLNINCFMFIIPFINAMQIITIFNYGFIHLGDYLTCSKTYI